MRTTFSTWTFVSCEIYKAGDHKGLEFSASFIANVLNFDNDFVFYRILSCRFDEQEVHSQVMVSMDANYRQASNLCKVITELSHFRS